MPRTQTSGLYERVFLAALNDLKVGQRIWLDELLSLGGLPNTKVDTKKQHLKSLVKKKPDLFQKILGLYPSSEVIIDLIEAKHGLVTESSLDDANVQAAGLVDEIARPVLDRFIQDELNVHLTGDVLRIPRQKLISFLIDDFTEFQKRAGNGLVSLAGGLNEHLLIRALRNDGLEEGKHFKKTGKDSQADLIIHSLSATKDNLGVEVKSYHARERLLRGLKDISGPKVGAGFFKDPSEFNVSRTQTLLQADPAAIYMPRKTLDQVDPGAQSLTTNVRIAFQSKLYRPIEQFVSDMRHFYKTGKLTPYQ